MPTLIPAPCPPSYPKTLTTIGNDWDDIDAVVNYVRALRKVDKVNTVAWSQGGPRSGGYAAQHPEKILRQAEPRSPRPTTRRGRPRRRLRPQRRPLQHAVDRRLQRALGPADGLRGSVDRRRP